jgi:hypothetical protein
MLAHRRGAVEAGPGRVERDVGQLPAFMNRSQRLLKRRWLFSEMYRSETSPG